MSPLSLFILPVAALATQTASSLSATVSPIDAALAR